MKRERWHQRIHDACDEAAKNASAEKRLRIKQFQEGMDFYQSFGFETDRGCALIATSHLDNKLETLLAAHFVDSGAGKKLLSDSRGGLGTFSARIELCYGLGMIGPIAHRELHLMRRIRNAFAHAAEPLNFADETILNRVRELYAYRVFQDPYPRATFLRSASGVLQLLLRATPSQRAQTQHDLSTADVRVATVEVDSRTEEAVATIVDWAMGDQE
jgi:DNA-binding MltR family transcriptional regulator